jgi:azurin
MIALAWLPAARADFIRISTLPGLRFDTTAFSVRPGTEVEIVFSNYDEMLHNFVIVKPGTRLAVVQAALVLGPAAVERNFVPDTPDVLWSSKIVPAGSSYSLKFSAPTTLGEYPYLCTFPGHGLVMFGTMIVTNDPQPPVMTPVAMPKLASSGAAPAEAMKGMDHGASPAVPTAARAVVTREFMPDSGPASIAVQLPDGKLAFCWDAGACRFRYAWSVWPGSYFIYKNSTPERGLEQLQGDVFYSEPAFPLRFGDAPGPEPKQIDFKGYTIDAQRIPEFELVADGVTVRERIEAKNGKLVRRFRTTGAAIAWFAIPAESADRLSAPGGTKSGAYFKFTGDAAQEFTISLAAPAPPATPTPPATPAK